MLGRAEEGKGGLSDPRRASEGHGGFLVALGGSMRVKAALGGSTQVKAIKTGQGLPRRFKAGHCGLRPVKATLGG